MARQLSRNPHVDPFIPEPPRLGGLTKDQEREVADLLEKGFGLNPKYGIKGNLATGAIFGAVKKIHGMSDKEWAEMLRGLPHYGDFQDQDIDAIQEHFLNKYPHKKILGIPIEFRSPWDWDTIGEKYGIEAGVIPSDAAYQKIMSISPDALSGVKTTGLDSYKGPIAETIEWKDVPKMGKGGLINGNPGMAIVGDAGPEVVISNNAEVVPLLGIGPENPVDQMYQAIQNAEHRREDDRRNPWIRNRQGTTAWGPVQILKGTMEEARRVGNLTSEESDYVDRYKVDQQTVNPNDKVIYTSIAKKLLQYYMDKYKDPLRVANIWRWGERGSAHPSEYFGKDEDGKDLYGLAQDISNPAGGLGSDPDYWKEFRNIMGL